MALFKRALSCKTHLYSWSSALQDLFGETVKGGTTGRKTPSKMHSVFEQQTIHNVKHIIKLLKAQSHKSCGIMVHPRFMGFEIQEVHVKAVHATASTHIRHLGLRNPDCVPWLSWPHSAIISTYPVCDLLISTLYHHGWRRELATLPPFPFSCSELQDPKVWSLPKQHDRKRRLCKWV